MNLYSLHFHSKSGLATARPLLTTSSVSPELCYRHAQESTSCWRRVRCCRQNLAQMSENCSDLQRETGVVLGFLEEAEAWQLKSAQLPSKVGGRPAWLLQVNLPTAADLVCEKCQLPTAFLLQVYAPIVGQERSFHRTLYVFCCKTPACHTANDPRCFKGNVRALKTVPQQIVFWLKPLKDQPEADGFINKQ